MFLSPRSSQPRLILLAVAGLVVATLACSDESNPPTAPQLQSAGPGQPDVRAALVAQERHNPRLRAIPGVVGTAVGLNPRGQAVVRVFTARAVTAGIPASLDNIPVSVEVTGMFLARSDPTLPARPAPLGFSVGHYAITAGTIGARVLGADGAVYILSNNHVLANSNDASIGDHELQPGPFDGGIDPDHLIGTLADFYPIDFLGGPNTMDAAIALSSTAEVGNSTPTDDGYGTPSAAIFDDANGDGNFDDVENHFLGQGVQKFGRTTKLTKGAITGINGTVTVCYWPFFTICLQEATFVNQLIIDKAGFSDGGDSGSLIVTDDLNKNPVGLLFAGGGTITVGNRIDLVLNRFGVAVDGSAGPTPPPSGSVHIGDLDRGSSSQGSTWTALVTVTAHDGAHGAVAGATVSGAFNGDAPGSSSCITGATGTCTVQKSGIRKKISSVTFSVTGVSHASLLSYAGAFNHDVDGGTNGSTITVSR